MTTNRYNNNRKRGCRDYEMYADDYFKSTYSKKSSLGHSKYVHDDSTDSYSIHIESSGEDDNSLDDYNDCHLGSDNIIRQKECNLDEEFDVDSMTDCQENNRCSKENSISSRNTHTNCYNTDYNKNYNKGYEKDYAKNYEKDYAKNSEKDYAKNYDRSANKKNPNDRYSDSVDVDEESYSNCSKKGYHHNHELLTSTRYTGSYVHRHNHRTAGVTGDAIKCGNSHVHKVHLYTDTIGNHFHEISDVTSKAIYLPNGKHIHILKGATTSSDGHTHNYYFTTLIDDPAEI